MASLYEISNELAAILGSDEDELSPEDETMLSMMEMAFEDKVEAVLQYRQGLLAHAIALKAERERLKAKEDAVSRKADRLKNYLLESMNMIGVARVSTRTFNATVAQSPPKVEIDPNMQIPDEYRREKVTVDLDKATVLEDFKNGIPLPDGITVVRDYHLKIS